jgi:phosphoribosylformylglycinamidine synthase
MAKIVVDVMLKPEILDPQGQAIAQALPSLGFHAVSSVRQGKHFELELTEETDPMHVAHQLAERVLANPVIEDYSIRLSD